MNEKYEEILEQFNRESSFTRPIEATDRTIYSAIRNQSRDNDPEYDRRNRLYTVLLNHYILSYRINNRHKRRYKLLFFIIINLLFAVIVLGSVVGIVMVAKKQSVALADLGVVLGAASGILSAIIVIPKIIAQHLFPKDEDANMIDMVKNMQQNDTGIRNWLHPDGEEDGQSS